MNALIEFLEMMRTTERLRPAPEGWVYRGIADFVLTEGRAFDPAPLPMDVPRGPMKQCFANAYRLMMDREDLVYAEGYAVGIIPVLHAWCVDADGKVVDPTWQDGLGSAYFGISFDRDFVMRSLVAKGTYGLIDDMKRDYPLIRGCDGWRLEASRPSPGTA